MGRRNKAGALKQITTQTVTPPPRRRAASRSWGVSRATMIGLILGITFLVFSDSIFVNRFAYDDDTQILHNQFIRSFKNAPKALVTEAWFWRIKQDQDPNKDEKK